MMRKRSGKWNFDKKIICIKCQKRPAVYKREIFCGTCYSREYVNASPYRNFVKDKDRIALQTENKLQNVSEIAFAQSHPTFRYEAVTFHLDGEKYTPDFYDVLNNKFYEIIGSRQRLSQLKSKLQKFGSYFPFVELEVCYGDGTPIEIDNKYEQEAQANS